VERPFEQKSGGFVVSSDPARLDRERVYRWLSVESYWAKGIPFELFEKALAHSLPFGVYATSGEQLGFARVTTDRATYGYLQDVFVAPEQRGLGLGRILLEGVFAHPDLQGFRRWSLVTRQAHALYRRFGFVPLAHPERFMERHDPDVYQRGAAHG
jgi:ribosomal protein S18 acetylase RimI-like enzyme